MASYNLEPAIEGAFQALDRRISRLEGRAASGVTVGNGAPAVGQPDGALYGDKAGSFFYIVLGGVAKKVAVA